MGKINNDDDIMLEAISVAACCWPFTCDDDGGETAHGIEAAAVDERIGEQLQHEVGSRVSEVRKGAADADDGTAAEEQRHPYTPTHDSRLCRSIVNFYTNLPISLPAIHLNGTNVQI